MTFPSQSPENPTPTPAPTDQVNESAVAADRAGALAAVTAKPGHGAS
jgi:hypothetical protein